MKANDIQVILNDLSAAAARHERRHYLGMSGIGRCPREQYWKVVSPEAPDARLLWYGMVGYALEYEVVKRLGGVVQARQTLVAEFDGRYMGHTDHEMPDGTLVEIKTVTWEKYQRLQRQMVAVPYNVAQCQAYMRHGGFPRCVLIYTPRDVPHNDWTMRTASFHVPFWAVDVPRNEALMDQLDRKAKRVLAAIDASEPPRCTCGWCRQ